MKIIIPRNGSKGREILYQNKWYEFDKPYEVDLSTALRMKRELNVDLVYTKYQYDPNLWKNEKIATFISDIDTTSGWGNVSIQLLKNSPGIKFSQIGRLTDITEPLVLAAARRDINQNSAAIIHEQPKSDWILSPFSKNICITPFETTKVPASWVPRLNSMDAVLVPCKQNIQMMKDSGVIKPVDLIHWGVDTSKFFPISRREGRPFTFGHMGALSIRKGTDILVRAFKAAFPTETDVRLINKTSNRGYPFMDFKDKRIEVQMGAVPHGQLIRDFFEQIDCFVFPTRGEGFGLPPLEAMATGVPAIATGWSGIVEFLDNRHGWLIDYTMDKAVEFDQKVYHEDCGDWAVPSFDHLVYLLRYAYEHRDEVKQKGLLAQEFVKNEWAWDKKISLFHDALHRYL